MKKLSTICYGIRVLGRYMNQSTLRIMYYAHFESVLKFGIIFWGRHSLAQDVFVVQKRIIRIIRRMEYNETCRNVFRSLGVMTFWAVYIYECLMFLFNNKKLFDLQLKNYGYSTRTLNVNYPIHRLTLTKKCPHYMCLRLFNALPNKIKEIVSQKLFRIEIKKILINLEPYTLLDFINA